MVQKQDDVKLTLPLLITYGDVFYPEYPTAIKIKRQASLNAVKTATKDFNSLVFVVAQKNFNAEKIEIDQLNAVGTICEISVGKEQKNVVTATLNPLKIVDLSDFYYDSENDIYFANGENRTIEVRNTSTEIAIFKKILELIDQNPDIFRTFPKDIMDQFSKGTSAERFCYAVANFLIPDYIEKQNFLEIENTTDLLKETFNAILKQNELRKIESELNENIRKNSEKVQREYYLREKMRAIKNELNDGESDDDKILEQLEKNPYPDYVKEKVKSELNKAQMMPPGSQESGLIHNYISVLMDVPWYQETEDNEDLTSVKEVLDKNHFGLEKVKERIIEYLAVKIMTGNLKSPILCLFGPPGVGKTSLAKSIAEALNRKFIKCSLGGISDEAEIRGHRRTYVGALPGRIIQGMRKAKVRNPLFLLDEVDKLDSTYKGDPASAMLEVLDPEQNYSFNDNYLEEPYDLSKVLFIATANSLYDIPEPLRDRMELIEMNSYTVLEKLAIAKGHLIPKIMERNNLPSDLITFHDEAILYIIEHYTREAGARELERKLETIVRKILVEFLLKKRKCKRTIDVKSVKKYLGTLIFESSQKEKESQVGVVTGLAYTSYGGEILPIEVNSFTGTGRLVLTGSLGDVMKESCSIAFDFVKSNAQKYGISAEIFEKIDLHIHVPEGATPKDGPSAGVAITLAIISCLTNKKINADIALTGEVTLRGRALAIGGLREKALAALRSGIKTIIVPKSNKKNVEELPIEVIDNLKIEYMTCVDDALKIMEVNDD